MENGFLAITNAIEKNRTKRLHPKYKDLSSSKNSQITCGLPFLVKKHRLNIGQKENFTLQHPAEQSLTSFIETLRFSMSKIIITFTLS